MAYLPTIRPIAIDMSKLAGPTRHVGMIQPTACIRTLATCRCQTQGADGSLPQEPTALATATGSCCSRLRPSADASHPLRRLAPTFQAGVDFRTAGNNVQWPVVGRTSYTTTRRYTGSISRDGANRLAFQTRPEMRRSRSSRLGR